MYMMNGNFSGYGYPNYVMYPSAVGSYMGAGPSSNYPNTDYRNLGQYEDSSKGAVNSSEKQEPEAS